MFVKQYACNHKQILRLTLKAIPPDQPPLFQQHGAWWSAPACSCCIAPHILQYLLLIHVACWDQCNPSPCQPWAPSLALAALPWSDCWYCECAAVTAQKAESCLQYCCTPAEPHKHPSLQCFSPANHKALPSSTTHSILTSFHD